MPNNTTKFLDLVVATARATTFTPDMWGRYKRWFDNERPWKGNDGWILLCSWIDDGEFETPLTHAMYWICYHAIRRESHTDAAIQNYMSALAREARGQMSSDVGRYAGRFLTQ